MFFILKEYVYLNQSGLLMDKYGVGECLDGPLKNFTNFLDNFFKVYLKKNKPTCYYLQIMSVPALTVLERRPYLVCSFVLYIRTCCLLF